MQIVAYISGNPQAGKKDLPGYLDIKTTGRYLHMGKKHLVNIISPFDDLWNNKQIDW